jgi:alkylation response protein AidB-like acyl-CoA dehydrogenase
MLFATPPEGEMLRDAVRSYLADKAPAARVRELMETDEGFDRAMWKEMGDMGWASVAVPETHGGAGMGYRELGIVMEELGRSLLPAPFLSSAVLGAAAVQAAGSESQVAELLPEIASGASRWAVAVAEPATSWSLDAVSTRVEGSGGGIRLRGTKSYVVDGHTADRLVIAARDDDRVRFFVVAADAEGLEAHRLETMDMTRKQAEVRLSGVEPLTELDGSRDAGEAFERLTDAAAAMLAHEQVGGAERCMEMSVGYAKERMQFGRPIGSFQAVKHTCAQMLIDVEAARTTALYASGALAEGSEDVPVAAALARVRCSEAFFDVAGRTIQVHGGIGFTWEHDAHLYFKRAKTSQLLLGRPREWRAMLAQRLGL